MRRINNLAAGIGVVAVAAAGLCFDATHSTQVKSSERQVVLGDGDDRLPSKSATDWVTYADHVVVVTATSEEALPPTRVETERGEGLLGRKVHLQVKDVLWSRNGDTQPAPQAWDYNAVGWVFSDGKPENRVVFALHDRPRIESGHRYILAISWEAPRCSPGDVPEPGRWMGLGEGSELPFDDEVIGQGENQGRLESIADARTRAAEARQSGGLEDELVGKGASELTARLKAAKAGTRQFLQQPRTVCN